VGAGGPAALGEADEADANGCHCVVLWGVLLKGEVV
jgi:hypothetical protein